jgi:dipeptidase E
MNTTRRTFLKTAALAGAAATLPASVRAEVMKDGLFPGGPNFRTTAAASVMVSGGTITKDGKLTEAVRAAHRLHYGKVKKILLILHASEPAKRDADEKKMAGLFAEDNFTVESLHHWDGAAARQKIREAEAFFVSGGETFLLLRTLMETGQLAVLLERALAGVPYNGTSAGCNIAGPNIGCTNDFPVVDVPTRNSLGLLPVVTNPHHPRADEKEYAGRVNKIRAYCRLNPAETVLGIGNGAVARLHGGQITIEHGPAFYYHGTEARELKEGPVPELTALVSAKT